MKQFALEIIIALCEKAREDYFAKRPDIDTVAARVAFSAAFYLAWNLRNDPDTLYVIPSPPRND